jgi:hypothetical protein
MGTQMAEHLIASPRITKPFDVIDLLRTCLSQITRGNVASAAKLAGRYRTDVYKLLARHGLQSEEFKIR